MGNAHRKRNGGEASATAPDTIAGGEPRKQFTQLVQDSSEKRCRLGEKSDRVSLASVSASESSYTSAISVDNTLGSLPDLLQPEAVYKHSAVESDTDTSTTYESAGENERSVSVAENASFSDPRAVSSPYGNSTLDSTVALDLSSDHGSTGATTEATPDLNNTLELNSPTESGLSSVPDHLKSPDLNLSDLALSLNNLRLETPAKSALNNKNLLGGILGSTKKVTHLVIDSDVSADVIGSDLSAEFERNPPSNEEVKSFIEKYLASGDNPNSCTDLEQDETSVPCTALNSSDSSSLGNYLNRTITPEIPCELGVNGKVEESIDVEVLSEKGELLSKTSEQELSVSVEGLGDKRIDLASGDHQGENIKKPVGLPEEDNINKPADVVVKENANKLADVLVEENINKLADLLVEENINEPVDVLVEENASKQTEVHEGENIHKPVDVIVEENINQPADVLVEENINKPADPLVEENINKPADLLVEENINKPADLLVEENINKPADLLVEENINKPVDVLVEENASKQTEVHEGENIHKPVDVIVEEDINQPADVLVEENINKPADVLVEENVNKPVDVLEGENIHKPVDVIVEEDINKPADVLVEENINKPADLLVEENINKPADLLVEENINKPADLLVEENINKPVDVLEGENIHKPVDVIVEEDINKPADVLVEENINQPADLLVEENTNKPVDLLVEEDISKPADVLVEENASKQTDLHEEENINKPVDVIVQEDSDKLAVHQGENLNKPADVLAEENIDVQGGNTLNLLVEENKNKSESVYVEEITNRLADVIVDENKERNSSELVIKPSLNSPLNLDNATSDVNTGCNDDQLPVESKPVVPSESESVAESSPSNIDTPETLQSKKSSDEDVIQQSGTDFDEIPVKVPRSFEEILVAELAAQGESPDFSCCAKEEGNQSLKIDSLECNKGVVPNTSEEFSVDTNAVKESESHSQTSSCLESDECVSTQVPDSETADFQLKPSLGEDKESDTNLSCSVESNTIEKPAQEQPLASQKFSGPYNLGSEFDEAPIPVKAHRTFEEILAAELAAQENAEELVPSFSKKQYSEDTPIIPMHDSVSSLHELSLSLQSKTLDEIQSHTALLEAECEPPLEDDSAPNQNSADLDTLIELCQRQEQDLAQSDDNLSDFNTLAVEASRISLSVLHTSLESGGKTSDTNSSFSPSSCNQTVIMVDNIDDDCNPFASKSKIPASPPQVRRIEAEEADPFTSKPKIAASPSPVRRNDAEEITLNGRSPLVRKSPRRPKTPTFKAPQSVTEDLQSGAGKFLQESNTNSTTNHSEAGPETASDFIESGEVFKDPSSFDFLSLHGGPPSERDLRKESLFVQFDPLVGTITSNSTPGIILPKMQPTHPDNSVQEEEHKQTASPVDTPRTPDKCVVKEEPHPKTPLAKNPALANVDKLISFSPTPAGRQDNPSSVPDNPSTANSGSTKSTPSKTPAQIMLNETLDSVGPRGTMISQEDLIRKLQDHQVVLAEQDKAYQERIAELEEDKERCEQNLTKQLLDKDKRIQSLNEQVQEKVDSLTQLRLVIEEYEQTISRLVAEKEHEKNGHEQAQQHLNNMEIAFSDVHSKYERTKATVEALKKNEEALKAALAERQANLDKMENMYDMLKSHAVNKLEKANQDFETMKQKHQQETAKLKAMNKKLEIKTKSLEETLEQKAKENQALTAICDELINKVGE